VNPNQRKPTVGAVTTTEDGTELGPLAPSLLVRLEGAAVAALAVYLYVEFGRGWLLFVVLILVPDLSIPAYFANKRLGAVAYNLAHTYVWSALLVGLGIAWSGDLMLSIGLIWFTHIGTDRLLGYGLKYPIDFRQTHIQRL
jgi:hypothetical protein